MNKEKTSFFDTEKNTLKAEILEEYYYELCEYKEKISKVKSNVYNELSKNYSYTQSDLLNGYIIVEDIMNILGKEVIELYYKETGNDKLDDLISILRILTTEKYINESMKVNDIYLKEKLVIKNIQLVDVHKFISSNVQNLYMVRKEPYGFNTYFYNKIEHDLVKKFIRKLIFIVEEEGIRDNLRNAIEAIEE